MNKKEYAQLPSPIGDMKRIKETQDKKKRSTKSQSDIQKYMYVCIDVYRWGTGATVEGGKP